MSTFDRKPGRNIARAWIDTVLNPLLNALDVETQLVRKSSWTWRYRHRTLEYLRTVRAHLGLLPTENLDQLLHAYPELRGDLDAHDRALVEVKDACAALHDDLVASAEFQQACERAATPENLTRTGWIAGATTAEERVSALAENAVNGQQEIPEYVSTYGLWKEFGKEFLKQREQSRFASSLRAAGARFEQAVESLRQRLSDLRLTLAFEHDLPYVEPRPPSSRSFRGEPFSDFT